MLVKVHPSPEEEEKQEKQGIVPESEILSS